MFPMPLLRTFFCNLILAAAFANASAAEKPPNVLFLSVDDLKPILGVYGATEVKTPNIDRLAARGTTMLNNYCQQAVCAPSRMSMFTGLRPDSTKVWNLRTQILNVNPSAVTMQQHFKENGYETAGAGKIMHGAANEHPPSWSIPFTKKDDLPYAEGYPVPAHENAFYQGEKEQSVYEEMKKAGIKDWKVRGKYMAEHDAMPATEALDVPDDAYVDGALATWANGLLGQFAKSGKPFFLTVGFMKPHLPFVAPKKYWDLFDRDKISLAEFKQHAENSPEYAYHKFGELRSYSDIPSDFNTDLDEAKQRELIHGYYACVAYIDAQVGKVLDELDKSGLADITIIVLWGDHGWHLGDHGLWCKHTNFEQATKAPLIISAPGFKPGQKAQGMTEFVDIFPTLVELAGMQPPYAMEGTSLVPVLKDASVKVKDYSISQWPMPQDGMGYTLRTPQYRFTMWMKGGWRTFNPYDPTLLASTELYDYEMDPLEKVSQAGNPDYAEVVADLKGKMLAYFKEHEKAEAKPASAPANGAASEGIKPGAGDEVIDLAALDPSSVETRFATVSKEESGWVINFENSPKWPSVDFLAPEGTPWDLTGYEAIEVKLTNEGTNTVKTVAYIANEGDSNASKKRNGIQLDIPAGETQVLRIDFDPSQYPLDLSRLTQLRIFVNKLTSEAKFRLHSVTAVKGSGAPAAAAPPKPPAPAATGDAPSSAGQAKPSAEGNLIDFAAVSSATSDLRFASVAPTEGGDALMLDFELSPKWPSVDFHPTAAATWDLSGYLAIEVSLTNESAETVKTFFFAANEGDSQQSQKRQGAKMTPIQHGATEVIRIDLTASQPPFDPSQVRSIRVFVGKHTAPVKLKLNSLKAVK